MAKPLIIIICVTFLGGALYIGGMSFFGGDDAYAAVATVNGEPISAYALFNAYYQDVEYYQSAYGQLDSRMLEDIRYNAYDMLVYNSLITQELAKRNYKLDQASIDAEVTEFKDLYGQEVLDMYGYTDEIIAEQAKLQLEYDQLIAEVVGDTEITDELIQEYYEEVEVSHILVRVMTEDEEEWEAARLEAENIKMELETLDFATAAQLYSDDGSASNGGNLGFIKRGETVEPFEEAAFSLEIGEISDLVRSQFGYHIIMPTAKKLAEGEEYEAAKETIRAELEEREKADRFYNWLEEQRNQAKIEILDNQLKAYDYIRKGDFEAAITAYEAALAEDQSNGYLYASIGQVQLQLGNSEEAISAYEKAVELVTNDGELYLMLATLYQGDERTEDAVEAYLKASELSANDLYTQQSISSLLLGLGEEEAAEIVDERIETIMEMYSQIEAEAQKSVEDNGEEVEPSAETSDQTPDEEKEDN